MVDMKPTMTTRQIVVTWSTSTIVLVYVMWMICSLEAIHLVWTVYDTWHSADNQLQYLQAEHTRALCEHNTLVRIDPEMGKICSARRRWYASSYAMNIVELVVLEHWMHIIDTVQFVNHVQVCGAVCTYQLTKLIDSIASSLFWVGPIGLVVAVLVISVHYRNMAWEPVHGMPDRNTSSRATHSHRIQTDIA
jgi:hypothetical protein